MFGAEVTPTLAPTLRKEGWESFFFLAFFIWRVIFLIFNWGFRFKVGSVKERVLFNGEIFWGWYWRFFWWLRFFSVFLKCIFFRVFQGFFKDFSRVVFSPTLLHIFYWIKFISQTLFFKVHIDMRQFDTLEMLDTSLSPTGICSICKKCPF